MEKVPPLLPAGALLPPFPYCTLCAVDPIQSKGAGILPQVLFTISLAGLVAENWATAYMVVLLTIDSRLGEEGATRKVPGLLGPKLNASWPLMLLVVGLAEGPER